MGYRILYHHRIRADDGQAVHVREMIGALRELGHEVEECALVHKAQARASTTATATPRPARQSLWTKLRVPRLALEGMEIAYGRSAGRLIAAGRRFAPHFIYERHALHCAVGLRAARALHVPLLLEVNSPMCDEMQKLGLLRFPARARRTEQQVLAGADRVLAVSEVLRQRLLALGARAEHTKIVRNGAEVARFGERARAAAVQARATHGAGRDAFVIGFVGYARPWHRLDVVLAALREARLAHAHLWIVGDGPALPELQAQAAREGLSQRLVCWGAQPPERVPELVCAFDAAVIPAINDYASPLKLFDYLAAGVPSVVPDQANLRELVLDGQHALLCPPGDASAMAKQLGRLAADPAAAVALGAAGRRLLLDQDWTWHGAARRVVAAYEEVAR